MKTVLLVSYVVMAVSTCAVIAVAMGLWVRDVVRERDTDGVEPAPVSARSAIFSLLALGAFVGVRLARGESVPLLFAALTAMFIGFALSASWYLLERRKTSAPRRGQVDKLSAVVAASFGALAALTP